MSRVTSFGADAPGISTPPITRSARVTRRSIASCVENSVLSGAPNCFHSAAIASGLRSITVTSAPMPSAIIAACVPTTPPPRITTLPGATPGTPPSSDALAAVRLLEQERAGLHGHAARDFAHRREQRQAAARRRHRLVGDADRVARDERLRLRGIGREMQVGEQDLPFAQHRAFGGLRLLHLDDHLGPREDLRRHRVR